MTIEELARIEQIAARMPRVQWKSSPSNGRGFEAQLWDADGRALMFMTDGRECGAEPDAVVAGVAAVRNAFPDLAAAFRLLQDAAELVREAKAWMPPDPLGGHSPRSTPEQRGAKCDFLSEVHAKLDAFLAAYHKLSTPEGP